MGLDIKDIVQATRLELEALCGKVVAVDAYNALYQFLAIIRGEGGEPLKDRAGRVTSHLSGLFYRNVNLLTLGIKPIYVLDGAPPSLKAVEIARRRAVKEEAVIKYTAAFEKGDVEEARKYAQATSTIKDSMVEDTKRMLNLLGIPHLEAPSEGEATAAHLTAIGIAHAVASQDFDSLLFGGRKLVRNVTMSGRRKLPGKPIYVDVEPELIELEAMLKNHGITREQLVDVGILVGTDFNPDGFKGIGPVKALKLVKEYGCLEDIPGIQEELARIDYGAIRQIFIHPSVPASTKVSWGGVDEGDVIEFLCHQRDFSEERIRKALDKLREARGKLATSLERWL